MNENNNAKAVIRLEDLVDNLKLHSKSHTNLQNGVYMPFIIIIFLIMALCTFDVCILSLRIF